jgi:hypothetical protein
MKQCVRLVAVAIAVCTVLAGLAAPAHASAYRYWSYWTGSGSSWAYSTRGPSGNVHDGDVIGWRFAVSPDSSSGRAPRASSNSLCSDGVTVVIDYGTTSDAPPGEHPPSGTPRAFCANDPDSTTGYRATDEHATLRVNNDGLVCGIDGYPKSECAPIVTPSKTPTKSPTATASHAGSQARTPHTHTTNQAQAPDVNETAQPGVTVRPLTTTSAQPLDVGASPTPTPTLLVTTSAPGSGKSDGSGVPVALIVGLSLAAVLGGAAVWRYRTTR